MGRPQRIPAGAERDRRRASSAQEDGRDRRRGKMKSQMTEMSVPLDSGGQQREARRGQKETDDSHVHPPRARDMTAARSVGGSSGRGSDRSPHLLMRPVKIHLCKLQDERVHSVAIRKGEIISKCLLCVSLRLVQQDVVGMRQPHGDGYMCGDTCWCC